MKIQVLGSGCPTCAKLNEITKKAVAEMGVNGEIAMTGFTPDVEKIKEKIQAHNKVK